MPVNKQELIQELYFARCFVQSQMSGINTRDSAFAEALEQERHQYTIQIPESYEKSLEIYTRAKINSEKVGEEMSIPELKMNAEAFFEFPETKSVKGSSRIFYFLLFMTVVLSCMVAAEQNWMMMAFVMITGFILLAVFEILQNRSDVDKERALERTLSKIDEVIRILKLNV